MKTHGWFSIAGALGFVLLALPAPAHADRHDPDRSAGYQRTDYRDSNRRDRGLRAFSRDRSLYGSYGGNFEVDRGRRSDYRRERERERIRLEERRAEERRAEERRAEERRAEERRAEERRAEERRAEERRAEERRAEERARLDAERRHSRNRDDRYRRDRSDYRRNRD